MQDQQQQPEQSTTTTTTANNEVIDKADYLPGPPQEQPQEPPQQQPRRRASLWNPTEIRTVPAFYPLEKSSRLVEDDTAAAVAARLSDCLRRSSVQAVYENDTAHLISSENVHMNLSLWKTPETSDLQGIVVELQRRSGDSIAFHRYARSILDAAMGLVEYDEDDKKDMHENVQYSKKVQRLLRTVSTNQEEHETAMQAMEIAHGLLMKDRMDARVLGLESLCLLTDPRKAGSVTSILTAHVVLLGSTEAVQQNGVTYDNTPDEEGPFQEIRASILNLVQFSRINQPDDDDDDDDDESSTPPADDDDQHVKRLHHLALAVLANALDVMEHPPTRTHTASSSDVASQFVTTVLPTLVSELGQAAAFPHAATLSAKCLGSLVRASEKARRRAKELGAKQVVQTALHVGERTHLRLELESQKLSNTLAETETAQPSTETTEEGKTEEEEEEQQQEDEEEKQQQDTSD